MVEELKRARYDDAAIQRTHPFLIKDVLFSAIAVAANEALIEIGEIVGAPDDELRTLADWAARGRRGLDGCWDPEFGLCLDYDLRAAAPVRVKTVAGIRAADRRRSDGRAPRQRPGDARLPGLPRSPRPALAPADEHQPG